MDLLYFFWNICIFLKRFQLHYSKKNVRKILNFKGNFLTSTKFHFSKWNSCTSERKSKVVGESLFRILRVPNGWIFWNHLRCRLSCSPCCFPVNFKIYIHIFTSICCFTDKYYFPKIWNFAFFKMICTLKLIQIFFFKFSFRKHKFRNSSP